MHSKVLINNPCAVPYCTVITLVPCRSCCAGTLDQLASYYWGGSVAILGLQHWYGTIQKQLCWYPGLACQLLCWGRQWHCYSRVTAMVRYYTEVATLVPWTSWSTTLQGQQHCYSRVTQHRYGTIQKQLHYFFEPTAQTLFSNVLLQLLCNMVLCHR